MEEPFLTLATLAHFLEVRLLFTFEFASSTYLEFTLLLVWFIMSTDCSAILWVTLCFWHHLASFVCSHINCLVLQETFSELINIRMQTAHFREFWDEANRNRDILEVVPGETFKPKSCVSSIVDWIQLSSVCFLSVSQRHDWVFPLLLQMLKKPRMPRFCVMVSQILGGLLCIYHYSWELMSQWVVVAAHYCYLLRRWWSDTFWATLMRLWLHSLSCYLQVVEISLQFHRSVNHPSSPPKIERA